MTPLSGFLELQNRTNDHLSGPLQSDSCLSPTNPKALTLDPVQVEFAVVAVPSSAGHLDHVSR